MPSPLATLTAILAQTCRHASQHQQLLSKNEAATRAVLIDPVLRALGWDTTNLLMVEPERTVENKQSLDYVLKGSMGNIQSVIEAKKPGESLDKLGHVGAFIGYAFSLKPVSFFITNGRAQQWAYRIWPSPIRANPLFSIQITVLLPG